MPLSTRSVRQNRSDIGRPHFSPCREARVASRADTYRANAAERDRLAASTRDPDIKAQFPDLARQWREMAELADRLFK
jgi:hypothetical protein